MKWKLGAEVTVQKTVYTGTVLLISMRRLRLCNQICKETEHVFSGVPCPKKFSNETRQDNARARNTFTFQVEVSWPVAFHMGNDAFAAAVKTRVIFHADPGAGGV